MEKLKEGGAKILYICIMFKRLLREILEVPYRQINDILTIKKTGYPSKYMSSGLKSKTETRNLLGTGTVGTGTIRTVGMYYYAVFIPKNKR